MHFHPLWLYGSCQTIILQNFDLYLCCFIFFLPGFYSPFYFKCKSQVDLSRNERGHTAFTLLIMKCMASPKNSMLSLQQLLWKKSHEKVLQFLKSVAAHPRIANVPNSCCSHGTYNFISLSFPPHRPELKCGDSCKSLTKDSVHHGS